MFLWYHSNPAQVHRTAFESLYDAQSHDGRVLQRQQPVCHPRLEPIIRIPTFVVFCLAVGAEAGEGIIDIILHCYFNSLIKAKNLPLGWNISFSTYSIETYCLAPIADPRCLYRQSSSACVNLSFFITQTIR